MILYRNIGCREMEKLCFGKIIRENSEKPDSKIPAVCFFYKKMPMEKKKDSFCISIEIDTSDARIIENVLNEIDLPKVRDDECRKTKQLKIPKVFLAEYSIADVRDISVCGV